MERRSTTVFAPESDKQSALRRFADMAGQVRALQTEGAIHEPLRRQATQEKVVFLAMNLLSESGIDRRVVNAAFNHLASQNTGLAGAMQKEFQTAAIALTLVDKAEAR